MQGTRDRSVARPFFFVVFILCGALCWTPGLLAATIPAANQEAEEEEEEYAGNFTLVFEPAKKAALKLIEKEIRESQLFDATVEELNDTLSLPVDLKIVFTQCGTVNAFYDPENQRVLMCYELLAFFKKQFATDDNDQEAAQQAMFDSTVFVFHHELGHALVHLLELPITGKEEDAVDDLATLVLLHEWEGGDESALSAANSFYMMGEDEEAREDENAIEKLPYYGEHSLGKQRYYQIACIVYGSDPEAHADLVGDALPKERAARCQAEYQQKAKSWGTLLADYYGAADEEEVEETAEAIADGVKSASGSRRGALRDEDRDDGTIYQVVVNQEKQYSMWPADRELPRGWKAVGKTGTKKECLDYIREVWAD